MRAAVAAASFMSLALLGPGIARATTVTPTFTFPSLQGYTSANGSPLPQFNPAAGTLNSIALHTTATATWSGGAGTDFNDAEYAIVLSGVAFTMGAATVGDGSAPALANRTDTAPAVLSAFTGNGLVDTSVTVLNQGGSPASISSVFGTESLSYTYTPSGVPGMPPFTLPPFTSPLSGVPVPAPSSLSLLAVGLLNAGWLSRRRLRSARLSAQDRHVTGTAK